MNKKGKMTMLDVIPQDVWRSLRPGLVAKSLTARDILFNQGDPGDSAFLVQKGAIRIERITEDGKSVLLALLGPGELLGEMALITGHPRNAHAVAHVETELLMIRRDTFNEHVMTDQEMRNAVLNVLSNRLTIANARIEEVGLASLEHRLAGILLDLQERFGVERQAGVFTLNIKITQSDLADMALSSREHINRILQRWRKDNVIDFEGRNLVIKDVEALEALHDEDFF